MEAGHGRVREGSVWPLCEEAHSPERAREPLDRAADLERWGRTAGKVLVCGLKLRVSLAGAGPGKTTFVSDDAGADDCFTGESAGDVAAEGVPVVDAGTFCVGPNLEWGNDREFRAAGPHCVLLEDGEFGTFGFSGTAAASYGATSACAEELAAELSCCEASCAAIEGGTLSTITNAIAADHRVKSLEMNGERFIA